MLGASGQQLVVCLFVSGHQGGNSINGVYYNASAPVRRCREAVLASVIVWRWPCWALLPNAVRSRRRRRKLTIWSAITITPQLAGGRRMKRNARVQTQPRTRRCMNYTFDISDRSKLDPATSLRFARTLLGADVAERSRPASGLYRYLPSSRSTRIWGLGSRFPLAGQLGQNIRHSTAGMVYQWAISRTIRSMRRSTVQAVVLTIWSRASH